MYVYVCYEYFSFNCICLAFGSNMSESAVLLCSVRWFSRLFCVWGVGVTNDLHHRHARRNDVLIEMRVSAMWHHFVMVMLFTVRYCVCAMVVVVVNASKQPEKGNIQRGPLSSVINLWVVHACVCVIITTAVERMRQAMPGRCNSAVPLMH